MTVFVAAPTDRPDRVHGAAHLAAHLAIWLLSGVHRVRRRFRDGPRDAGDVPGWVLVTIMTAGLVVALWAIAGPKLGDLFTSALDSVKGP